MKCDQNVLDVTRKSHCARDLSVTCQISLPIYFPAPPPLQGPLLHNASVRSKRYKASPRLSRTEAASQRVKIVAVTAWGDELSKEKIKAAEFDLHLTKPSPFGELVELFNSVRHGMCVKRTVQFC
jgi:CheY-like chemotaxis protein